MLSKKQPPNPEAQSLDGVQTFPRLRSIKIFRWCYFRHMQGSYELCWPAVGCHTEFAYRSVTYTHGMEISYISVQFLDLTISKGLSFLRTGLLTTSIYFKHPNTFSYLHGGSYIASHILKGIAVGEVVRTLSNTSSPGYFRLIRAKFFHYTSSVCITLRSAWERVLDDPVLSNYFPTAPFPIWSNHQNFKCVLSYKHKKFGLDHYNRVVGDFNSQKFNRPKPRKRLNTSKVWVSGFGVCFWITYYLNNWVYVVVAI